MINNKKIFFFLIFLSFYAIAHGVTYDINTGRLGDRIKTYAKSKWFAYLLDCPFYYKPFAYSDQMMMHELETRFSSQTVTMFERIVPLRNKQNLVHFQRNNVLFETEFYHTQTPDLCRCVIESPDYGNEIRKMAMPRGLTTLLYPPPSKFSIAVHVRRGSNGDWPMGGQQLNDENKQSTNIAKLVDYHYPDKFLPDQFFIDQVLALSDLLGNRPIFVFIFTDHNNPQAIMNLYKNKVNRPNVSFDCRKVSNCHNHYVMEDFFSMAYLFDCLIRSPDSNFGWAAQLIGNHKIVIYPKKAYWKINKVVTEDVQIVFIDRENNKYEEVPLDFVGTDTLIQFLEKQKEVDV